MRRGSHWCGETQTVKAQLLPGPPFSLCFVVTCLFLRCVLFLIFCSPSPCCLFCQEARQHARTKLKAGHTQRATDPVATSLPHMALSPVWLQLSVSCLATQASGSLQEENQDCKMLFTSKKKRTGPVATSLPHMADVPRLATAANYPDGQRQLASRKPRLPARWFLSTRKRKTTRMGMGSSHVSDSNHRNEGHQ